MARVEPRTLVVDGLGYHYPRTERGLDSCTLEAREGELTVIRGESGSGKSTLLACLGGILTPQRGSIRIDGTGGAGAPTNSAIVTQGAALFEHLTVWQNVATAWGWPRTSRRSRAIRVLDGFDVGRLADSLPREISFGQRQRVAIAGAVAGDTRLLLADEPTGSLDDANTARVISALRVAAERRIVVVVTHDERIAHAADRTIHLAQGVTR
jgi:ABC-type lipoprotein export system ATPase subunit